QASKDPEKEALLRQSFVDELATRLDLAVKSGSKRVGVLFACRADDEVPEASLGLVPLGREPLGELARLLPRGTFDTHLPRRVAVLELFLLPRLTRWLVIPAVLLVEPVLDLAGARLDAAFAQLRIDDGVRLLGCGEGSGVDEDRLAVAGNGEPAVLQLLGEL